MKSSKRKVGLMLKLDKDGNHRLSNEAVFLNVLHSRCKTWRTYTLSYYDIVLKQLVKLATMEVERENGKYCEIFFQQISKMLNEYIAEEVNTTRTNYAFNPTCTNYDEHVVNRIGISAVLGERFIKERTSSYDYRYDQSVERHKRYLDPNDVGLDQALTAKMKNSVTVEAYDTAKSRLANLIKQQLKLNQKPLEDTLRFWDVVNYRWATAFK